MEPDNSVTLNLWGTLCADQGDHRQAIDAFRNAIKRRPNYAIAWHNLANSLHLLGHTDEAAAAYAEAVRIDANLVEAQYELAAAGKSRYAARVPRRFVERMFNSYAATFDQHLAELKYSVPQVIRDLVVPLVIDRGSGLAILDLGCGTGLAGEQLRSIAAAQTGIDVSDAMLRVAGRKTNLQMPRVRRAIALHAVHVRLLRSGHCGRRADLYWRFD